MIVTVPGSVEGPANLRVGGLKGLQSMLIKWILGTGWPPEGPVFAAFGPGQPAGVFACPEVHRVVAMKARMMPGGSTAASSVGREQRVPPHERFR